MFFQRSHLCDSSIHKAFNKGFDEHIVIEPRVMRNPVRKLSTPSHIDRATGIVIVAVIADHSKDVLFIVLFCFIL